MSRPEDIPQDVWVASFAASVLIFDRLLDEGRIVVISMEAMNAAAFPIARAIMAAKEEERKLKDIYIDALNKIAQVDEIDIVLDPHWAIRVAGAAIREGRAAIRSTKEPK